MRGGPHPIGRILASAAGAALLVGALPACGASEPTSAEAASAEVADIVCTTLREWNNELGDELNRTSQAVTDDDDPTTANSVLLEGIDELIALAETNRDEIDELDLPDVHDREALLEELTAGAEQSVDELERERERVADLEPITVGRQAGALGGAFTSLEGALAVLEPEVARYRSELRDAFVAEEGCRHVVQPVGETG
jgi:hypothetical protein